MNERPAEEEVPTDESQPTGKKSSTKQKKASLKQKVRYYARIYIARGGYDVHAQARATMNAPSTAAFGNPFQSNYPTNSAGKGFHSFFSAHYLNGFLFLLNRC